MLLICATFWVQRGSRSWMYLLGVVSPFYTTYFLIEVQGGSRNQVYLLPPLCTTYWQQHREDQDAGTVTTSRSSFRVSYSLFWFMFGACVPGPWSSLSYSQKVVYKGSVLGHNDKKWGTMLLKCCFILFTVIVWCLPAVGRMLIGNEYPHVLCSWDLCSRG